MWGKALFVGVKQDNNSQLFQVFWFLMQNLTKLCFPVPKMPTTLQADKSRTVWHTETFRLSAFCFILLCFKTYKTIPNKSMAVISRRDDGHWFESCEVLERRALCKGTNNYWLFWIHLQEKHNWSNTLNSNVMLGLKPIAVFWATYGA